ncbi:hypothetical protein EDC39_10918 [Geothermobacter ehrlichii]|uniref:Uncharacterized protein n=1 Tax=Geothermobacter ehrlichii TaxID=213224 RepID=A0A5D3WKD5_9BACT|nr:hypothetical protein [Geothermobacter ehrlichii]TYO97615.1 hypothetical protein EDC39_10918 [Geothermobacter ehrlichii]
MKHPGILALALLIIGCSGSQLVWQHPSGLGETERLQAERTCDMLIEEESWRTPYFPPYYGRYFHHPYGYGYPFHYRHSYGYSYYDDPGNVWAAQKAFRVCMRAKGWEQVEVDEKGTVTY